MEEKQHGAEVLPPSQWSLYDKTYAKFLNWIIRNWAKICEPSTSFFVFEKVHLVLHFFERTWVWLIPEIHHHSLLPRDDTQSEITSKSKRWFVFLNYWTIKWNNLPSLGWHGQLSWMMWIISAFIKHAKGYIDSIQLFLKLGFHMQKSACLCLSYAYDLIWVKIFSHMFYIYKIAE